MSARRIPFRRRWALTIVAVAALLVGCALAIAGVATRGGGHDVVLDVDPIAARATPVSMPPPAPGVPVGDGGAAVAGLSPRAAGLGERLSAIPVPPVRRPQPVTVEIESIDVARYPIRPIALAPDGQLEIPDETEIGWYRLGASPGTPGATVLAAHVAWNRTAGPFARLGTVEPGTRVAVTLDDGTVRRYEVVERAVYGKLELPKDRLWRTSGPEELVLITCGGDYNPDVRRYAQNVVVYAVPIA